MKKTFGFIVIFFILFLTSIFGFFNLEKIFYSEFSLNYGTIISPSFIESNTTGTFDTPVFDGKLGIDILKWVNIYTGLSFAFFVEQSERQNHYTFVPLFFGIKLNLFPDFFIYPAIYAENGKSISNYHFLKTIEKNNIPWTGYYYNFGFSLNWKINDIFALLLNFERPGISFYNKDTNEIHIFKTGLSFKILY